ncbi:unnamed protein product, partial [Allacma fusca]
ISQLKSRLKKASGVDITVKYTVEHEVGEVHAHNVGEVHARDVGEVLVHDVGEVHAHDELVGKNALAALYDTNRRWAF